MFHRQADCVRVFSIAAAAFLLLAACSDPTRQIDAAIGRLQGEHGGYRGALREMDEPVLLRYRPAPTFAFELDVLADRDTGAPLIYQLAGTGRVEKLAGGDILALEAEVALLEIGDRSLVGRSPPLAQLLLAVDARGQTQVSEIEYPGWRAPRGGAIDEATVQELKTMVREDAAGLIPFVFPEQAVSAGEAVADTNQILQRFKLTGPIASLMSENSLKLLARGLITIGGRSALLAEYTGEANLVLPQDPPAIARIEARGYSAFDLESGLELLADAALRVSAVSGSAGNLRVTFRSTLTPAR